MGEMYDILVYDNETCKCTKCDEIEIDSRLSEDLKWAILKEILSINKKEQNGKKITYRKRKND